MSEIKNDYQKLKTQIVDAIKEFEAKNPHLLFSEVSIVEIDRLIPNTDNARIFNIELVANTKYLQRNDS